MDIQDIENNEFKITTNHDEIREWIEERNGEPTLTNDDENDGQGVLAIRFDDSDTALESISWQEFFDTFESLGLAFRCAKNHEEQGIFSYSFIPRYQQEIEAQDSALTNELPEDTVPIENLYPSAPALDVDTADSPYEEPDYPGEPENL